MLMMAVSKRGWRGSAPTFVAAPEPFQSWRRIGEGADGSCAPEWDRRIHPSHQFHIPRQAFNAHGVWRQIVQAIGLLAAWRFRHP